MLMDGIRSRGIAGRTAALCAVVLLVSVTVAGLDARAALVDIQKTQTEIDKNGGGWTARRSWVTELDEAGARRLLGAPAPKPDGVEFSSPRWFSAADADSVDWRSKDGANWVSPILNQGNCGSCVAFAAVATLETQVNIASGLPWLNPRFSTQALFACGGGGCGFGWMPTQAAQYLVSSGIPDEACAPYTMGASGEDVECGSVCRDSAARSTKIASYSRPSRSGDGAAVKAALRKGPLMTTLSVYADFMAYGGGVYKHSTGSYLGGHAVSIVGFDDAKQAWIIRNSWGPEWGDKGFAYVSYDDPSGVSSQTWQFEAAPASGFTTIRNLRDRDYLSGAFVMEAATNAPGATGVKATVADANGRAIAALDCAGAECALPLDVSGMADGQYELRAEAVGAVAVAQPRYFYVANAKPTLAVDFSLSHGDIAKPLKGRVEFTVRSSSSTVPLSSLEFVATKDGKEVVRHRSDMTLPTMAMGWRTNLNANGAYDVYFVARVATNAGETVLESRHATVQVQN